jgi:methionyl aminopeptidase
VSLVKSPKEIELVRESCRIVSDVLKHIKAYIAEGITTGEIDRIIEDFILSRGGRPAFKGYKVKNRSFPASSCISVNEEVVHGIPGKRKLKKGDIVSVDVGVEKNGYFGDSAYTFPVGEISAKKQRLLKVTEESLYKGIARAVAGNEINDIGAAVQNYVEGSGFSVVKALVGHGIGKNLHEEPAVPNYFVPGRSIRLMEGMLLAIEPMVNYGTDEVYEEKDGWTIVTADNQDSAHFEHTVLVKKGKAEILT